MDEIQVVVVGAGAAGVAAAARLMERGVNVTILEAEQRMGGRIHTVLFEDAVLDLGAQWVHGEVGNVVFYLANKYGLLTESNTRILESPYIDCTGKIVDQEVADKIIRILSFIHKNGDSVLRDFEGSLGDYYNESFQKKMEEEFSGSHSTIGQYFLDWFQKFENSIDGSDSWFETSGRGLTEYWDCEGNLLLSWKSGGYQKALDLLMNKYPGGEDEVHVGGNVKYNKEVTHIKWNNVPANKVLVECSDGSSYAADHVILTVSLGVLKEKAHSIFYPALPPKKLKTIEGLGIGCVNKIYLKFPYQWWPELHSGFNFLWTDEEAHTFKPSGNVAEGVGGKQWLQDVFGFYSVDNQPLVLCGWIVGPSARYMEQLSDEQVIDGCVELLQKFAGKGFNLTVPKPERMVRSAWSSNPHFRGSYSFRSMTSETLGAFASHLAEPLTNNNKKPVLLFAGEATHEHYYSTVHGAVESGWREADRIFAYYGCCIPKTSVLDCRNSCQVVIVGAGIAGLAAAKTLVDNGLGDIIILEAQDHSGGRISSMFLNGGWIETGAQWIHGQNNEVWKLAHKYDLLSTVTSSEGEGIYIREDGVVFDPTLVEEVYRVVTEILQECEQYADGYCDMEAIPKSIGHHLKQKFEQYLDSCHGDSKEQRCMKVELYDWHLRFQVIDNSCTILDKLSAKAWGNYLFSGGNDYVNFKKGYSSLIRAIVEELPTGTLFLNSPVTKVKWQQNVSLQVPDDTVLEEACKKLRGHDVKNPFGTDMYRDTVPRSSHNGIDSKVMKNIGKSPVTVLCNSGAMYTAGHVIVTCSLGCLKDSCKTMFEPELPRSMIQAIEDMGFAAINKIFLDFKEPWWSPDIKGFQLIWSKDNSVIPTYKERSSWTQDLTGFDVVCGQEGVLLGWVGGKGAELVEDLAEEEIGQHCTDLLRKFTLNEYIPLPRRVIRSQWHKNPYIRGGYSNSTSLCDVSSRGPSDLATPVWADVCCGDVPTECRYPVVLLAGEATHEHYFSTTHGAYDTGQAQAKV
ncbi:spermine oxidase-like isoform X2 [Zootermopsis nevadensis]|nr:spermine oxidase-like isoform X2 [Zootermopsis nevadensis]